MSSSDPRPRVAVIGGQGIGRFHAALYERLGADVVGICCSTSQSSVQCAYELARDFGVDVTPYDGLEDVLDQELDGVSLCTPPAMHFEQLLRCFDRGVAVFCEKPMFWTDDEGRGDMERKVEVLRLHPKRRVFVNTSNTHFLDVVMSRRGGSPKSLSFNFFTQGPYTGRGIGVDLLPHALSFVLWLFGLRTIENFSAEIEERRYACGFRYGDADVFFDLREDPAGPKRLSFVLDGREYVRASEGFGPTYKVWLEDVQGGGQLMAEDPFKVFLGDFLVNIRTKCNDSFNIDAANLSMMADLLERTDKQIA